MFFHDVEKYDFQYIFVDQHKSYFTAAGSDSKHAEIHAPIGL